MGVCDADIEKAIEHQQAEQDASEAAAPQDDFEVFEDVWESWLFFLKVQRQWVFVPVNDGMGVSSVRISLNWPAIESVVRLKRIDPECWDGLVDDLLVIEGAVLKAEREAADAG